MSPPAARSGEAELETLIKLRDPGYAEAQAMPRAPGPGAGWEDEGSLLILEGG